MKKRILAAVLAVAVLLTTAAPAFGTEFISEEAETQEEENIFSAGEAEFPVLMDLPENEEDMEPVLTEEPGIEAASVTLSASEVNKCRKEYERILNNWRLAENYINMDYLKMYFGNNYIFQQYFLYDLDGDGLPELFLYSALMRLTAVLTYDSGLKGVGYLSLYGINPKTHELIEHGHWHGSGGSDDMEWSVYPMAKKNGKYSLEMKYYIDKRGNYVSIGYYENYREGTQEEYNKIYGEHVKDAAAFSKFERYALSDSKEIRRALPKVGAVSLKSVTPDNDSIAVKWNAAEQADGYYVYRKVNAGSWKRIGNTGKRSFKDSDVKVGNTYTYTVRAYNKVSSGTIYGSYDTKGKSVKLTTLIQVTKPKAGSAKITWKRTTGAEGYRIYRAVKEAGPYTKIRTIAGDTRTYTDSGLKKGGTYYYKVTPYVTVNGKKVLGKSSEAGKIKN